eukprot:1421262-Rhodomonas_salina.1
MHDRTCSVGASTPGSMHHPQERTCSVRVQCLQCSAAMARVKSRSRVRDGVGVSLQAAKHVELIVSEMQKRADSAAAQQTGCEMLRKHLATLPRQSQRLGQPHPALTASDERAIDAVVAAMQTHTASTLVQEAGARVLLWISALEPSNYRLQSEGAIQAVVGAVKLLAESPEGLECAVMALYNILLGLGSVSSEQRAEVVAQTRAAGASEAVIAGMVSMMHVAWDSDSQVHATASHVLRMLAGYDHAHIAAIVQAGGVGAVLFGMRRHAMLQYGGDARMLSTEIAFRAELRVQTESCEALLRLMECEEGRAAAVEEGGIRVVVAAMELHGDSFELQQLGCALLEVLARAQGSLAALLEQGSVRAVLAAMRGHRFVFAVQEPACILLSRLLAPPRAGHCDTTVEAEAVPQNAMDSEAEISVSGPIGSKAKMEIVKAVVAAMDKFPTSEPV